MKEAEFLLNPLRDVRVSTAYGNRKLNALQIAGIKIGSQEPRFDPAAGAWRGMLRRRASMGDHTLTELGQFFWQLNNTGRRPSYTPLSFAAFLARHINRVDAKPPTHFAVQEAKPTPTLPNVLYAITSGGQKGGTPLVVRHAMVGIGGKEAPNSLCALQPDGPIVIAKNTDLWVTFGNDGDRFVELRRA